jgi:hypothetical protein
MWFESIRCHGDRKSLEIEGYLVACFLSQFSSGKDMVDKEGENPWGDKINCGTGLLENLDIAYEWLSAC